AHILAEYFDSSKTPLFYPFDSIFIRIGSGVADHEKLTGQLLVGHCQENLKFQGFIILLPEVYALGRKREAYKKAEEKREEKLFQM
ncbi:MAG: hypothetical protein IKN68_04165, partial [Spirochaetia bacterium]|nr:hypothetical protein [Spirochaetia bacterium]